MLSPLSLDSRGALYEYCIGLDWCYSAEFGTRADSLNWCTGTAVGRVTCGILHAVMSSEGDAAIACKTSRKSE